MSFNTKVSKLATLAIERKTEISEAIRRSKRSLASNQPFRLTGLYTALGGHLNIPQGWPRQTPPCRKGDLGSRPKPSLVIRYATAYGHSGPGVQSQI
jgi:hypothetical protein